MPHVLVIDDNTEICELLAELLQMSGGYRVTTASDAAAALAAAERDRPALALVDAVLPGSPCLQLAAEMRRRGIPVIVMSGAPGVLETLDQRQWPLLAKPFSLAGLLDACRSVLARAEDPQHATG